MKNRKHLRVISLFSALLISVSVLSGCNGGTSSSDVTSSGGGVTTSGAESTSGVESAESSDTSAADGEVYESKYKLSNPNATTEAKKLYDYINSIYREKIISGQQESTWMSGGAEHEMNHISEATGGKLPAIRGLDYMHMDFDGVNQRAIEWWEKGGIVTICWHCGTDFTGEWTHSQNTTIKDWDAALTEGTPEYEELIAGMDMGAEALLKLQEAGVPVLWRPFHELNGDWFWWSKGGAENFKKLWKLMYDRYTNHWGLNNLIWVFGYSHKDPKFCADWYVGDEYCDIVGADSYSKGPNQMLYKAVGLVVEDRKPICFHECGVIPTPEQLTDKGALWSYFMTWHTDYITKENSKDDLNYIYNHDYVITLDELPSFR
ncbi:MAG: hypothetical protein IJO91_02030 [Oscillospiraceae bacterium]|nr:hypothetical protein [Oscillospiraceae bacterium]